MVEKMKMHNINMTPPRHRSPAFNNPKEVNVPEEHQPVEVDKAFPFSADAW